MKKNLDLNPQKIAKNAYTISHWMQSAAKQRRCWKTCGNCKRPWTKTGTKSVSYAIDRNGKAWGICDDCLPIVSEPAEKDVNS